MGDPALLAELARLSTFEDVRQRLASQKLTLGARKRLELRWRAASAEGASSTQQEEVTTCDLPMVSVAECTVNVTGHAVDVAQRRAWLAADSLAVGLADMEDEADVILRRRCRQAEEMVTGGTLVRRMEFAIELGGGGGCAVGGCAVGCAVGGCALGCAVGCAEVLLVRQPRPPERPPPCRICMEETDEGSLDDSETLNHCLAVACGIGTSALAASEGEPGTGITGGRAAVPCGRLMRDICACRGSAAAVHEGCLLSWVVASGGWHASTCRDCKQRYIGPAAMLLARLFQRMKALEAEAAQAAADEARAGASPSDMHMPMPMTMHMHMQMHMPMPMHMHMHMHMQMHIPMHRCAGGLGRHLRRGPRSPTGRPHFLCGAPGTYTYTYTYIYAVLQADRTSFAELQARRGHVHVHAHVHAHL